MKCLKCNETVVVPAGRAVSDHVCAKKPKPKRKKKAVEE